MSSESQESRASALVEAFTELGPAWGRWVNACLPDETVSYARLRVLTVLECAKRLTMKQLAAALDVTPRRITALVDALEADGMVERYANPSDGRSTVIEITEPGLEHQHEGWKHYQGQVATVFDDMSEEDQDRLLAVTKDVTQAFRRHLAALSSTPAPPEPTRPSTAGRLLSQTPPPPRPN